VSRREDRAQHDIFNVSEFLQPTENVEVPWGFRIGPENGIMEWWNAGILVFKRIIAILILSSIPPVAGPLIQHCIIPEPIIPLFHCSINPIAERSGAKFLFTESGLGKMDEIRF